MKQNRKHGYSAEDFIKNANRVSQAMPTVEEVNNNFLRLGLALKKCAMKSTNFKPATK